MEMIPVTELKLKIIMKKEDLKKFELRADDLDYGTTETKKMLWSLLADAKRDYGFDTDGYRILVQPSYPFSLPSWSPLPSITETRSPIPRQR